MFNKNYNPSCDDVPAWPGSFIDVPCGYWDLSKGQHPALLVDSVFYGSIRPQQRLPVPAGKLAFPVSVCGNGHNVAVDNTYTAFSDTNYEVPLSPLFARDLAGRVIYLGIGPEAKKNEDWQGDKSISFPNNCYDVTASVPGADLIENAFLTAFRCLDVNFENQQTELAGRKEVKLPAVYEGVNLYPYKLRIDSFYADGWRLPQTELLYARNKGVDVAAATAVGHEFLEKWKQRPSGQSYEDFYEQNGGENWFERLFMSGCTVVPTFEACNGYNQVNAEFELEDFYPGRAVQGMHKVVERVASDAPEGTILDVRQPGFMTGEILVPAHVVVSDGSGYVSPHEDEAPLLPDLRLPHPRTSHVWGATWLPTQPSHFEVPAIWGWDEKTGRFLQVSGPLWDPLHYYYACTPKILKAFREPLLGNRRLATVPEEMKRRFYPVEKLKGFEVLNPATRNRRIEADIHPRSGVDKVPFGAGAGVGYHPLPPAFEFEIDSWWFPDLDPRHRVDVSGLDEDKEARLAPVICSGVSAENYNKAAGDLVPQIADYLCEVSGDPLVDYPFLGRFFGVRRDDDDVAAMAPLYLQQVNEKEINGLLRFNQVHPPAGMSSQVLDALSAFTRDAGKFLRLRQRLFRRQLGWYALGWWSGFTPEKTAEISDAQPGRGRTPAEQKVLSHAPLHHSSAA